MKRFLMAAGLAILFVAGSVGSVWAQGLLEGGMHLQFDQGGWRFHRLAYSSTGNTDAVGWYSDSVAFNRVGAGGATMSVANAETSTVFLTKGWTIPSYVSLVDTSLTARVAVWDAGASDASIDSLQLAIQVSFDQKNWLYVSQITGTSAAINPITATSPQISSFTLLNLAGATTTTPKVFSIFFGNGVASGLYPSRYNWWQYPAVRFILLNKTVGAVQHNFNIGVEHWTTNAN